MKKILTSVCLMAGACAAPAFATVIDFESTGYSGWYNSLDYAIDGYLFSATLDNIDLNGPYWPSVNAASGGNFAAINNYGGYGEITRADGSAFSFDSLWVRNWLDISNRQGTVTGLLDGIVVAFVTGQSNGAWNQLVGNFSNIDTLRIDFGNYFLIDDISLSVAQAARTPVPEPGTTALFGLGMLGFALSRRRKQQA